MTTLPRFVPLEELFGPPGNKRLRAGFIPYTFNKNYQPLWLMTKIYYSDLNYEVLGDFGGRCKTGETPAECALRELEEESGGLPLGYIANLLVDPTMRFRIFAWHLVRKGLHYYLIFVPGFLGMPLDDFEPTVEIADVGWQNATEVLFNIDFMQLHSPLRSFIEKWRFAEFWPH